MEMPIPNFLFMGVQFVHLLALAVWVGGIVILRTIIAPMLFQTLSSQEPIDFFLGEVFRKFNQATLFCAGALIVTGVIKFLSWENLTPWNTIRYFAIFVMSLVSLYTAYAVVPKIAQRGSLASSVRKTGPRACAGKELECPSSSNLKEIYVLSDRLMMVSLICGLTALLMA